MSHSLTTVPNAGLANTPMNIEVKVDAPANLVEPTTGWQYYRIRTLGTMPLLGPPRSGYNKEDNRLRKLTLRPQRFIDTLFTSETSAPHAGRRIEAIVKPTSSFDQALLALGTLDLSNQNIVIDSYDSRDTAKSTNGLYDVSKRQQHGNIATNGSILDAGGAYVYGDVSTNAGVAPGVANVTGIQRTDFYQDPIPIGAPSWPSINPSPSTVNNNTTVLAASANGQITAAVYAPGHDVTINGGGNSGHVFGSVVRKSATMTGVTNLHYDEALTSGGLINNYKIVSWFEDNR